jgi:hypothetical protein
VAGTFFHSCRVVAFFGVISLSSKHSDEALLQISLKLTDPYEQSDVIHHIPQDARLLDIINTYVYEKWPQEKVHCAKCGGHHHKRGFTALLTNGKRVLLGSSCGAEAFGESWTAAEKRMDDMADRQYELVRIRRLSGILGPMARDLAAWPGKIDNLVRRRDAFDRTVGELASRVREAATRHDGALTVTKQVALNSAFRQAGGGNGSIESTTVTVGRLQGKDLFDFMNLPAAVNRAMLSIQACVESLKDTNRISTATLRKQRKALENSFQDLIKVWKMYEAGQEFFTPESFRIIIDWTVKHSLTQEHYSLDGALVSINGRPVYQIPGQSLADLDTDVVDLIVEYRRAD